MSLIVQPYRRDDVTDAVVEVKESPEEPFNDLFGPESWRHSVWGSKCLEDLGCEMLGSLRTQDIYADTQDLNKLEEEIAIVANQIDLVSSTLHIASDVISFRLNNVFEAIRMARQYENGGVYIG